MSVTGAARGGIKGIPLVVGCGSNVVDLFFPLRAFPQAGDKAYFANEQVRTQIGRICLGEYPKLDNPFVQK
jgi:hypothetical protein